MFLYGFTFVIPSAEVDSSRYGEWFVQTSKVTMKEYLTGTATEVSFLNSTDVILPSINLLLSRVTSDVRFLFGVFAIIFGLFYLKSIGQLYDKYDLNRNKFVLIYLFGFIFVAPIFQINGFRYNTACWIFFWGAYNVVFHAKKEYLVFAVLAVMLHFSFLSLLGILLVYLLVGNREMVFLWVTIFSFAFSDLLVNNLPFLDNYLSFFSETWQEKLTRYTSDSALERLQQGNDSRRWYLTARFQILVYSLFASIVYLRFRFKEIAEEFSIRSLYAFTLLTLTYSNLVVNVPSGIRFRITFYLFALAYLIVVGSRINDARLKLHSVLMLFPILLFCAVEIRIGLESVNVLLFTPIVLLQLLFESDMSLYTLLWGR